MGNNASVLTEEQNEEAGAEALALFQALGVDAGEGVSPAEWEKGFEVLDKDGNGRISRKEWCIQRGSTPMYDAITKKHTANITRAEWCRAFEALDTDADGKISVKQWLARRKVQLGFFPLGLGLHNWGAGVGEDFYEVAALSRSSTEMAVVGPRGVVALGDFASEEGARETWLEAMWAATEEGRRHESTWLQEKGEPGSRPQEVWQSYEHAGWTSRTDEEIEEWIRQWVLEHPTYQAIDAIGRECNDQTFALAFTSWLIGTEYRKITDNTKGRALVYGGLTLLAGLGVAYAVKSSRKSPPVGEEEREETA